MPESNRPAQMSSPNWPTRTSPTSFIDTSPRQESDLNLQFSRLAFYPLNYRGLERNGFAISLKKVKRPHLMRLFFFISVSNLGEKKLEMASENINLLAVCKISLFLTPNQVNTG